VTPFRTLLQIILVALVGFSVVPARADSSIWARAAVHAGVPVKVIHGIALTESGRIWSDGSKRPWPWTLNSPRGPMFFPNKEQAAQTLTRLLQEGLTNIDIGYMQVNCGYHCSRVSSPTDLLDPNTNLLVAAQILKEVKSQLGGDVASSVGAYHAGLRPDRKERAAWYRDVVASHIRRLPRPEGQVKGS